MARGGGPGGGSGGGSVPGNVILQGGNLFGEDVLIGPLDAQDLVFQTNGLPAWEIGSIAQDFYPVDDGQKNVGTPHERVKQFNGRDLRILQSQDDAFPVSELDQDGLKFGPFDGSADILVSRADAGAGAFELFAQTPSGTYQLTPTSGPPGNAFVDGGNGFGSDASIGTLDDFDLTIIRKNVPFVKIEETGTIGYTGPRMLIGDDFAPLYANGDIVSIKKSLGDQLLLTVHNPYGQGMGETDDASASFVAANDLGGAVPHTASLEIFNSTWTPGSGGVNADEAAVISFGGVALRLLTQNAGAPILVSPNMVEMAEFIEDSSGQQHLFRVKGAASRFAILQAKSIGTSGTGYGARFIGTNADGKNFYASMPDSGVTPSWNDFPDYLTISTDTGIGMRATVNQSANSGWQITEDAEFIQCTPPAPVSGAAMFDGSVHLWLDESLNKLNIRAKKSDGTVLNLTTPLALS